MQECTVDASSNEILFSCVVDGTEAIESWQIRIYKIADNNIVYDSGVVSNSKDTNLPFYPISQNNQSVVFSRNITQFPNIIELGEDDKGFVNDVEPYYWTIEFVDSSGDCVVSIEEAFYANKTPVATILYSETDKDYNELSDSVILSSRKCFFKANYFQEESINLKRYGWKLIDVDTEQVILDTISNNLIYGGAHNISCYFDGFVNDGNYSLELYIETQNGTKLQTNPIGFSVSYNTTALSNDLTVQVLKEEPSVLLDWGQSVVAEGVATNEVQYLNNYPVIDSTSSSVVIPDDTTISFDYGLTSELDISETSNMVLSMQFVPNNSLTTLFEAEGYVSGCRVSRKLYYDSIQSSFVYNVVDASGNMATIKHSLNHQPSLHTWYVIVMTPTSLVVSENIIYNANYPKTSKYPAKNSYPYFGEWVKVN